MDHVPKLTDPVFPPIQIPCLSQEPYENKVGGFENYPGQRGWDINLFKRGVFTQHSFEVTGAFLQDWLFFGLLHEVLGDDGTKEKFSRWDEQSNQMMVTTKPLVSSLKMRFWQIRQNSAVSLDGKNQAIADLDRIERALCVLSLLCNVATAFESINTPLSQSQWPLSSEIDLSIRALGQLLATGVTATGFEFRESPAVSMTFPGGKFTLSRMREAGWCPSDIAMVSEYMSASSLYYASSLRRSQLHSDHSNCGRQLCFANQVDTTTYQTAHWDENCTCDHIRVPVSKLIPIIAEKGIPMITITIAASGNPVLEILPYSKGQHYIAFSHVWSDGMGNLRQNSLPRCQILRLKALVDELSWSKGRTWDNLNKAQLGKFWRRIRGRTVAFWLDTLCIPVGSEHQKYRSLAIGLMYQTYVSAQDVLVLDSELQKTPIPDDNTETFLRISVSGWMRRLWTLQESVLGRRLQVKFQDGIVDLVAELNSDADQTLINGLDFENYAGSPGSDSRSFYWEDRSLRFLIVEVRERKFIGTFTTHTPLKPLDPVKEKTMKECSAILKAFVLSNYRSSLRKSDEHLCLSGLLGWDTACLNGVPTEQRMKTLLSKRTVLPQGLLFIAGPRMREKGWRWALQSFGNNGSEQLSARVAHRDETPAKLCAKGLIVQYPGFIIPSSERPINMDDFFVDVPLFEDQPPVICRVHRHVATREERTESKSQSDSEVPTSDASLGLFFFSRTAIVHANVPMGAIIVEMDEESDEDATCELEGALTCSYTHLAKMELLGLKDVISPVYPETLNPINVHSVSREDFGMKRWCVG